MVAAKPKKPKKPKTQDEIMASVVSAEMGLTPKQAAAFITNLSKVEKAIVMIRPAMAAIAREMEVRRRMALIAPDYYAQSRGPGLLRRLANVAKLPVQLATGAASGLVKMFKADPYSKPYSEWSLPMLEAEVKRLEGAKTGA